jgi:hypothetical protein
MSHYTCNQTPEKKRSLEPLWVSQKMYVLFIEHQRNTDQTECEEWIYRDIFQKKPPPRYRPRKQDCRWVVKVNFIDWRQLDVQAIESITGIFWFAPTARSDLIIILIVAYQLFKYLWYYYIQLTFHTVNDGCKEKANSENCGWFLVLGSHMLFFSPTTKFPVAYMRKLSNCTLVFMTQAS